MRNVPTRAILAAVAAGATLLGAVGAEAGEGRGNTIAQIAGWLRDNL